MRNHGLDSASSLGPKIFVAIFIFGPPDASLPQKESGKRSLAKKCRKKVTRVTEKVTKNEKKCLNSFCRPLFAAPWGLFRGFVAGFFSSFSFSWKKKVPRKIPSRKIPGKILQNVTPQNPRSADRARPSFCLKVPELARFCFPQTYFEWFVTCARSLLAAIVPSLHSAGMDAQLTKLVLLHG